MQSSEGRGCVTNPWTRGISVLTPTSNLKYLLSTYFPLGIRGWAMLLSHPANSFLEYVCVCVCVCARVHMRGLSHVQLFTTPWTIAHQAPLSIGSSRQEYSSGWPCPPQKIFPTQGLNPGLLHWQVDSLPLHHAGKDRVPNHTLHARQEAASTLTWVWIRSRLGQAKPLPLVPPFPPQKDLSKEGPPPPSWWGGPGPCWSSLGWAWRGWGGGVTSAWIHVMKSTGPATEATSSCVKLWNR